MYKFSVSVIIVSLNSKNNFLRTLKSTISQKFNNYEIIVVDGNSIDGTKEEIKKYKNKIDKKIVAKDRGIYDAMNKGVNIASGNWIIFMNSGDIFYNSTILQEIKKLNLNNYDIVYGNTIIKKQNLIYKKYANQFKNKTALMAFCHQSCIVKSHLFKKKKFNISYKFASDFDFFKFHFSKNKKFFFINKFISKVAAGGYSDTFRQEVLNENIKILKNYRQIDLVLFVYLLKIRELLTKFIKLLIPKKFENLILRLKYNSLIVKKIR